MKAETLRKSILQYAIQGKLVPQVATEEPASVLLEKIKSEKQELIKQGKIKKEKSLPSITEDEKPFDIPDSWEWVRLCDVAILFTGNSINAHEKKKKYTGLNEGYNYIATKDVYFDNTIDYDNGIKIPFDTDFKIAKNTSSLLCIEGGSAGRKVGVLNQDVCFGNKLCSFEPIMIDYMFLFYFLQSPVFTENFTDNKSGMIGGVGVNTLKTLALALPPLSEQKRIVARIEELMILVDEYEKKEIELSLLEKEFPEKLKKSILQYAIQGKLVPQIEMDEPASMLLEKIKTEKQELIKQGKIKKEKSLPPITEDEKPFEIPNSWEWVRLNNLFIINPRNQVDDNTLVSFIPMSFLEAGFKSEFTFDNKVWLDVKSNFTHIKNGDVGFAKIVPCFQNRKSAIFDNMTNGYGAGTTELHILREFYPCTVNKFVLWFVKSAYFLDNCEKNMTGTAGQQRVPTNFVKSFLFPLPPIAEQERIVARVEELFELVDLIASGKKLKKPKINENKPTSTAKVVKLPVKEDKAKVDVASLAMVARVGSGVTQDDVNDIIRQVQSFYDKKN